MSVPTEIKQIVLKNAPIKEVNIKWGESDSTFEIETVKYDPLTLKDGDVVIKVLYFSNDPTQRPAIQKGSDPKRTYAPPILEGEANRSLGVGEIVESRSSKYAKGDVVSGVLYWGDYVIVPDTKIFTKIDVNAGLPLPAYLANVGLTGLTAYFGLKEVGKFEKGQSVVVSAASGATGSMVVQLAKILGAGKIIGITGSDEKGKWVQSLGADFTVNYNDEDWKKKLSDYIGDDFADIYFDNVGGEILSFMLTKVKRFGHVVACGAISGYQDHTKLNVSNWSEIIVNRLKVQGFIVSDFAAQFPEAIETIVGGIKTGAIKLTEGIHVDDVSSESDPLSKVPAVWEKLFSSSKPNGKSVTKIA